MIRIDVSKQLGAFGLAASFEAPARGATVVFGASGAGKSCLLAAIAGLVKPDSGRIEVAGETLLLEGCGRTDFPGGDVADMFRSLQQLAKLPGDPTVFPGHWYSQEPSASLDEVRRTNYVYRVSNLDQWRTLMGG